MTKTERAVGRSGAPFAAITRFVLVAHVCHPDERTWAAEGRNESKYEGYCSLFTHCLAPDTVTLSRYHALSSAAPPFDPAPVGMAVAADV